MNQKSDIARTRIFWRIKMENTDSQCVFAQLWFYGNIGRPTGMFFTTTAEALSGRFAFFKNSNTISPQNQIQHDYLQLNDSALNTNNKQNEYLKLQKGKLSLILLYFH
jgi:hypothetical protein